MFSMEVFVWMLQAVLSLVVFSSKEVRCLKNVELSLEPPVVQESQTCILRCSYDLEDKSLYTVKWYRGNVEFYRYTPADKIPIKVFPRSGINVNTEKSNGTQVVLENVNFQVSGNVSCEVTQEDPLLVAADARILQVVRLPETSPKIRVSEDPFGIGDQLTSECMSPESRPPATLKFYLNDKLVARTDPLFLRDNHHKNVWSDLNLKINLTQEHFEPGELNLRCEAIITNIYYESVELKLKTVNYPVPSRVRSENSANSVDRSENSANSVDSSWITYLALSCFVTHIKRAM